tara:strand:+ start:387 stop:626 length:240 start_codon:yes stop_codon:yes gene_type:complete
MSFGIAVPAGNSAVVELKAGAEDDAGADWVPLPTVESADGVITGPAGWTVNATAEDIFRFNITGGGTIWISNPRIEVLT